MARASEDGLRTEMRRAGMAERVEIVPDRDGFRVRPIVFAAAQAGRVRAYLTRVAAAYENVQLVEGYAPARRGTAR